VTEYIREMNLKEEKFILAHSWNHSCLVPLFRACGEAEHHDGEGTVKQTAHLMVAKKQREKG
jgi:hypothetical protein